MNSSNPDRAWQSLTARGNPSRHQILTLHARFASPSSSASGKSRKVRCVRLAASVRSSCETPCASRFTAVISPALASASCVVAILHVVQAGRDRLERAQLAGRRADFSFIFSRCKTAAERRSSNACPTEHVLLGCSVQGCGRARSVAQRCLKLLVRAPHLFS